MLKARVLLETCMMSVKKVMVAALSYPLASKYPLKLLRAASRSASNIFVNLSLWATPLMMAGDLLDRLGVQEEGLM